MGSGVCDAEIKCLSRVLALLSPKHVPVTLQGCSVTLFNAFSVSCQSEGSQEQLFVTEYTPEVFKAHVHDAGLVGASSLDPFAVLEYLMLRLVKAIHQAWLMGLPQFCRCIRQREVPFASLCAVLEELVQHWADVKLFPEESIVASVPKGRAPLNMSRVVVTDSLVLPRLSLMHVLVACFQANFEKQFVTDVSDYSGRSYAEFCFFSTGAYSAKWKRCPICQRLRLGVNMSVVLGTPGQMSQLQSVLEVSPLLCLRWVGVEIQ